MDPSPKTIELGKSWELTILSIIILKQWIVLFIKKRALIDSSNSEYPVLFTSEQLKRKWRRGLRP